MPLLIACPGCSKQFRVGDEYAGKQVKCPACQTVFQLPQAQQPATTPQEAAVPKRPPPRDSGAGAAVPTPQPAISPQPHQATASSSGFPAASFASAPAKERAQPVAIASLVLGIFSLVGELLSMVTVFFGGLCCLCLPFGLVGVIAAPSLLIPAGIGLVLGLKAEGNLKAPAIALNAISLALGLLTIIGMIVMLILFGSLAAMQPQGQPFPPPQF